MAGTIPCCPGQFFKRKRTQNHNKERKPAWQQKHLYHQPKGGVGKTRRRSLCRTAWVKGKQALLIDLDPQGQAAATLGMTQEPGAYCLLAAGQTPQNKNGPAVAASNQPGQSIDHPGQPDDDDRADDHQRKNRPLSCIRKAIEPLMRSGLDYIVFDTAPSVGGIQERAIWASDLVIIPSATDYLSTDGVRKVSETILTLKNERIGPGHYWGSCPPCMTNKRVSQGRHCRPDFWIWRAGPIAHPSGDGAARMCRRRANDFEKEPGSRASIEYQLLVNKVLKY